MSRMNLGIKYCGGCNPHYDRSHAIAKLLTSTGIVPVYDTGTYCPIWLAVSGCERGCAYTTSLRADTILSLCSEKDFHGMSEKLPSLRSQDPGSGRRRLYTGMTASLSRRFTEKDVLDFAALTGDRNGVHLDPAIADLTLFRRPVVHGALVSTLFSAILGTQLPGSGTILIKETVQYLAPVFPEDTITASLCFVSSTERSSFYTGCFEGSCTNADGTEVCRGSFLELLNKKLFTVTSVSNNHKEI